MVLYPAGEGTTFDHDYWLSTHMPMLDTAMPGLVRWEADLGTPGAPYVATAHLYFDSADAFGAAMGAESAAAVLGDIPNYTNAQPMLVVNEMAVSST
jgi:uncharacterized protein (TIGR02118 family)